nr:hypothetical protein [Tanacetum cinerariifolium]
HAEETVATADTIKGVDAFESKEVLGNQPKPTDAEKGSGSLIADKYLTEVDYDLELRPNDEIKSISELEADDDEDVNFKHKAKLSKTDEATTDDILDKLVDMANSKDANINAFIDKPTEKLVSIIDPVTASPKAATEGENVSTRPKSNQVKENEPNAKAQGEQTGNVSTNTEVHAST